MLNRIRIKQCLHIFSTRPHLQIKIQNNKRHRSSFIFFFRRRTVMAERKSETRIQFHYSGYKIGLPEVDKVVTEDIRFNTTLRKENCFKRRFVEDKTVEEDRISKLPEDALQFIVSSLPMREGAATSILSRRWRNVWSGSVTHLHFNDSNVFGYVHPRNFIEVKERENRKKERHYRRTHINSRFLLHRPFKKKGVMENERTRFTNRVNRILKLRSASRMDTFSVRFPLGSESASRLNRWMKLAAVQGVTKAHLDFNWDDYNRLGRGPCDRYKFPIQGFGSSLKYLSLVFCIFDFPPCFQGLNSLVSLNLYESFLTGSNVQNILSNCPSLEVLSLSCCEFPDPTILKFVGPSIPIKQLHICVCTNIKEIELRDVNVLSFELQVVDKNVEKLSIKNVPHLSRLVLHTNCPLEFSASVPHLETLFLKYKESKLPKLSGLNNLKQLVFSAKEDMSNLYEVVCLLETCPLLQQLELDMGTYSGGYGELTEKITNITACPHNNLSEVVIRAFENHPEQIELAKYLLKNAIVLKKMKIYTTCKTYNGNGRWRFSENGKLVGMALKEVYKLLKQEARPSTKLVFMSNK